MRKLEFSDEEIEIMAHAAHEAFCRGLLSQGYQYGAEINTELKTHPALVEYEKLPEDLKEASRASVRAIPNKLSLLGCRIESSKERETLFNLSETDMDRLARLEHQRWMTHKIENGWSFGPKTDPDRKVHASLVEWEELSEEERQKDRDMIRSIPQVLAEAGYVIVTD